MLRPTYQTLTHLMCLSLLFVMASLLRPTVLTAQAHEKRSGTASVCPGFVVLPTGIAVLSQAESTTSAHAAHAAQPSHHGHAGSQSGSHAKHSHAAPTPAPNATLMGLQHGHAIVPQAGMLCVPLGSKEDTAWMAVSHDATLHIMAASLQGPLTHNSRTNEAFALTVVRRDSQTPLPAAQVRVLVRMPHHDHRMPGGHGAANDPDVQGFTATRNEQGRYVVSTVDFSMPGPWLVEVQVHDGATHHTAYFAVEVGEE